MSAVGRRGLRRTAGLVAGCLLTTGLAGCGEQDDTTRALVLEALSKAITSPHTFVHVDQDLNHKTTVSAEIADSLRYKLLLNIDGRPIWQKVVRDDAVADLFLDPKEDTTYAGAGSSPAVNVVTDYQAIAGFLPKDIPPPALDKLPRTQPLQPSLALLALQQGKWVIDPTGAPVLPNVGTAEEQLATSPFLRPLLMLAAVRAEVDRLDPQAIVKYSKDDLSPMFKPKDDPFPQPDEGIDRYDVAQADLPQVTATSRDSRPDPPGIESLRKLAIYLKDGKVVQIRENFDVLDRLEDLARLYQVPLKVDKNLGTVTQQRIGQLFVQLIQPPQAVPYRVHEEQLFLSYPNEVPTITLPRPAVKADLSLFPGQGRPQEQGETATDGANSGGSDSPGGTTP